MWKVLKFEASGVDAHRPVFLLAKTGPLAQKLGEYVERLFVFADPKDLFAGSAVKRHPQAMVVDLDELSTKGEGFEASVRELHRRYPETALVLLASGPTLASASTLNEEGTADYLIKPVTAQKLAWVIRHSHPVDEFHDELNEQSVARALGQLSACLAAGQVKRTVLKSLQALFRAEGAVWLSPRKARCGSPDVGYVAREGAVPETVLSRMLEEGVPFYLTDAVYHEAQNGEDCEVVIPTGDSDGSSICLWRVERKVSPRLLAMANVMVEHAQSCLMHLCKVEDATHQAFVDDLTGLYNARYLNFALKNASREFGASRSQFSVLFIDVDHFKAINDTHGHLVGSEFLKTIAKTIQMSIRKGEDTFRYGGDEFVVLLKNAGLPTAKKIAERIRRSIDKKSFAVKGKAIHATVSIGIASFPDHASENETLMRLADEAMYHAKQSSRNAVHLAFGVKRSAHRNTSSHKK